jgi:hypothetical protein
LTGRILQTGENEKHLKTLEISNCMTDIFGLPAGRWYPDMKSFFRKAGISHKRRRPEAAGSNNNFDCYKRETFFLSEGYIEKAARFSD